jgi:hypothetical protein
LQEAINSKHIFKLNVGEKMGKLGGFLRSSSINLENLDCGGGSEEGMGRILNAAD